MTADIFNLSGKTAIITGASRGIGEAIARQYAFQGANVVISSRDLEACERVASSINAESKRDCAHAIACNISYKEQLQNLVDKSREKFGTIDILVSNAAVNPYYGPSSDMPDDKLDKILTCNIKASHWLAQMVLPAMRAQKDGAIIIVSSIGAFLGSSQIGAYNMSKAADLQLARNLAVEAGPDNIRVNCICPGVVKTYFAEALWKDPKIEKMMTQQLPLRRFGEPEDIAGAAVFLASRAGQWMTGQQIVIDGGTLVSMGGL